MNEKDAGDMRHGFTVENPNLRGAHSWTAGQEQRNLAARYRDQAENIETVRFHRLARALRELSASYDHEAERLASTEQFDH